MQVSPNEARDALEVVAATEERTRRVRTYQVSSPHMILWGVIWLVGYTITGLAPVMWINISWFVLVVLGILGGAALPSRTVGPSRLNRTASWIAVLVFYFSVMVVMQPTHLTQFAVFPALCGALLWAVMGVMRGPAYLWLSAAMFALSMGGYLLLPAAVFPFWLAVCGGGTLISSGIWLGRK